MSDLTALVTNDDGIDSPGLAALARGALDGGLSVVVAAPAGEASGTSAGLLATEDHRRILTERRTLPGLPDLPAFAVSAHPGLIAFVACNGGFGDTPDVLLSGINRGANIGRAVLHSGTVGAALTASINGVRALAVSLDTGPAADDDLRWDTAAEVARRVLAALVELAPGTVLSVNVPNVPVERLRRPRPATLAPFGTVQTRVRQLDDGCLELVSVERDEDPEAGTDAALLAAGHPTVTALRSVDEDLELVLPPLE